jgi:hypothetical protein
LDAGQRRLLADNLIDPMADGAIDRMAGWQSMGRSQ